MIALYGYGVVGKAFAKLLAYFSVRFVVIDDNTQTSENFDIQSYKLVVVCTGKYDVEKVITNKLTKKLKIDENKIKCLRSEIYTSKSFEVLENILEKGKITLDEFLCQGTKYLDNLQKIISRSTDKKDKQIGKTKLKLARLRHIEYCKQRVNQQNIFYELRVNATNSLPYDPIVYPYFVNPSIYKTEFGFREAIDWTCATYKNKKIVCVFGNSQVAGATVKDRETFPKQLELYLNKLESNKYCVLNFAIPGCSLVKQMQMFLLFAENLSPSIVISFFGIELYTAFMGCEKMLKNNILTSEFTFDKIIKELYKANVPLAGEARMRNLDIDEIDVINYLVTRYRQFKRVVESNGVKFIGVIQPSLFTKRKWHKNERLSFEIFFKQEGSLDYKKSFDNLPEMIIKFKQSLNEDILDMNELFLNDERELLNDHVHPNFNGNITMAEFIGQKLIDSKLQ